ncbi:MAG: T9SS type A sorting domain-containing protein, partial [Flavobacteriales bacterium]
PTFTATDTLFEDLDFGYTAAFDTTVLVGSFTSSPVRCAAQIVQFINILNLGSTMPQGVVALEIDPVLSFSTSLPMPDSIVGQTCFWHFDSLGYHQQWTVQLFFGTPGFQAVGDTVHNTLLTYADDGFGSLTLVSSDPWQAVVTCAYDPNDKLVSPAGTGPGNATPGDTEWLTYTVRFQNTGSDTAFVVVIEDQLSQYLQWSTLQFLGASHELTGLSMGPLGKASFRFENIQLPDSSVNEPGSHGFVKYRIKMQQGLPHLTRIENNAGIFFDLNPPVITNTALNTLVDCATATWTVSVFDGGSNDLYAYTFFMDTTTYTYQWYVNGTPIPGATDAFYLALENGGYSAVLTDAYGCNRVSDEVNVIVTGIAGEQGTRMSVQPNPFTDRTLIRCSELLDPGTRVDLVDVHGRVVRTLQGNGTHQLLIERGDLPAGIYVVRLWRGDGAHSAVRILVQ